MAGPPRAGPCAPLAAVAGRLRCPNCGAPLGAVDGTLRCERGHSFDVARQGHVTLRSPRHGVLRGDTAQMVVARETFLGGGHYAPIAGEVALAAEQVGGSRAGEGRLVADVGAGTGHYLAALLSRWSEAWGLALDASAPALRRAARAHPRIAAVACDVWQSLPLQDRAAQVVLNVFAPRNLDEIARVLSPRGLLVVVTPTPEHLQQLVGRLGLLAVATDKQARLHAALPSDLEAVSRRPLEFELELRHPDIEALAAMGPSAHHVSPGDLRARLAGLPPSSTVTASVVVETFRRT